MEKVIINNTVKEITSIEDLHEILLDIAKVFDVICRKHNIPYYMLGGTMLGAIRHKGFIPWDDDMDFGVERQYYDRLKLFLAQELPKPYVLKTINNSSIISDACKISDESTGMIEGCLSDIGINIDIFPLDHTNGNKGALSKNNIVHKFGVLNAMRFTPTSEYKGIHKILCVLSKITLLFISKRAMIKLGSCFISKGDFVSNLYGYWGVKETVPSQIMGNPKPYKFESIELFGPVDPDKYLTSLYNNYMEIPPINKRHIHLNKCWRK